jgi:sulfite exporter TauE/SafE
MLNKIVKFLWILFFAFLVLLIQFRLQANLRPLISWIQRIQGLFISPVFWGFAIGIIFGLITCPICGVPLATYVAGREEKLLAAVFSSILFTLGRFMVFLILGILAGLIGEVIVKNNLFRILGFVFALAGIFMLILSFDLSGLIDIRKYTTQKIIIRLHLERSKIFGSVNHPLEYFIWGSLLGIVCSLEGFAFVLPVWTSAVATANIFYAVLVMFIFALGAFIPPTILIFSALGSVRLADYLFKGKFIGYVRKVGAVVLFVLGCGYIFFGIKSARLLLFGLV